MPNPNWTAWSAAVVNDHLMARLLVTGPLRSPERELRMTRVRRDALFAVRPPPELLAHLAIQGFLNEYAWREDAEETAQVEALKDRGDVTSLLKLACYRSLGDLPTAPDLLGREWPQALAAVVRVQVADVLAERRFAESAPAITPIRDGISLAVKGMYEENPYPRWAVLADVKPAPLADVLRAALPDAASDGVAERPEVLVAGCGTGRHAIQAARRYAGAQVLAVDLSRASLGYAIRKTREMGLRQVEYAVADMLELPALGRSFDVVEAIGSLQCMDDPSAGLAALTAMLRPGGLAKLGLYSATARAPLQPAMRLGEAYARTPDGIRTFRARILDAPAGDPLRAALEFGDFYSTSSCRDLLLHVKEHVHTIPQIGALAEGAGLEVLGFDVRPDVRQAYRAMFPDDPAGRSLENWRRFEAAHPNTFRNMYQVWLRKPA